MSIAEYTLAHHGIKGQKWGIRRFQNADGTLTEKGRKRYKSETGDVKKAIRFVKKVDNKINKVLDNDRNKVVKNTYSKKEYEKIKKYSNCKIPDKTKLQKILKNISNASKISNPFVLYGALISTGTMQKNLLIGQNNQFLNNMSHLTTMTNIGYPGF